MSSRLATRHSLIARLPDWKDRTRWEEFYDIYWKLIHKVARKSGLLDEEAYDVVQETILTVAQSIDRYDRTLGSFRVWLLQLTRRRIADQLRKRSRVACRSLDSVPECPDENLDAVWDSEWQSTLFNAAVARVKQKVSARNFQIFDCAVQKGWPVTKVAKTLRVSVAQVYLARCRVAGMIKREMEALERFG